MKNDNGQITIKFLLLLLISVIPLRSSACSCGGYIQEFCYAADTSDFIVLASIVSFDDFTAARFKVVEELSKSVPDTISVLGQDGLNCNFSLDQYQVGDTLILNLDFYEVPAESANSGMSYNWGVENCTRNYLEFENDNVIGILGTLGSGNVTSYSVFKENLFECFDFDLSSSEIIEEPLEVFPVPFKSVLNIRYQDEAIQEIKIYNLQGLLIQVSKHNSSDLQIDLSNLQRGNYFIEVRTRKHIFRRRVLRL